MGVHSSNKESRQVMGFDKQIQGVGWLSANSKWGVKAPCYLKHLLNKRIICTQDQPVRTPVKCEYQNDRKGTITAIQALNYYNYSSSKFHRQQEEVLSYKVGSAKWITRILYNCSRSNGQLPTRAQAFN